MKLILYLGLVQLPLSVKAYGDCTRDILAQDKLYSKPNCLLISNSLSIQWYDKYEARGSHQILTQDLPDNIVYQAVPKCVIVNYGSFLLTNNVTDNVDKLVSSKPKFNTIVF